MSESGVQGSTRGALPAERVVTAEPTSDREFTMRYTFGVPAARVYEAYTDPGLVPQWWDPRGGALRVEALDARPGGKWRFVQRLSNGQELAYSGTYLEVRRPSRLVYTFGIEGQDRPGVTASVDLRETGGRTELSLTNVCSSTAARDAMIHYGAAAGAQMAWDRLASLLGGA